MAILCEKGSHKYYFPTTETCSGCHNMFYPNQLAVIRIIPKLKTKIFCERCIKHLKKLPGIGQQIMGKAVRGLVANTFVVDEITPPPLGDGQMDLSAVIIDHTKYAGREEYSRMDTPLIDMDEVDKRLNAPLSVQQIESHLKEKTPIIPHSNQLEDKRKK